MGWYVFQSVIAGAVMTSNAYQHWTPNNYLAGMIGFGAAYLATLLLRLAMRGQNALQQQLFRRRQIGKQAIR